MYKRTIWQDHVEGIQDGTDMNAANFNNLEAGAMEANAIAALNTAYQRYAADVAKNSEPVIIEENLLASSGVVFIAIPDAATRNNINYNVVYEIVDADDAATIGVGSKQANGFGSAVRGPATSVRVRYIITGGMI